MNFCRALLALTIVITSPLPVSQAAAGVDDGSYFGEAVGDALTLAAQREALRDQQSARAAEAAQPVVTGPVAITTLVIACQGNGPGANEQTGLFCDASRLGCQNTPEPGDILYWRWPGTRLPDGTTTYGTSPAGTTCLGPDEAAAAAATPVLTLADFRRLPLPPGTANVEPGTGRVLINVPTNVYVTAEPVQMQTTLIGQPVTVRATPAAYTWDFGDGTTLGPTPDAGGPYPAMTTTHTYTAPGDHAITLTTAYTGQYSVAGGPYLPVDGQAQVTGPAVPLTVLAGRNRLVADTLAP